MSYWFRGQKIKGQGHGALMIENGFRTITDPVIHLWNFMHFLLMSQGCAPFISGSKGQGHRAIVIENRFRTITESVIHLGSWNFIHLLLMSQGCALSILGSKVFGYLRLKIVKTIPCKIQKNWCTVTVAPTIEHHGGHSRTPANQRWWDQVPMFIQRVFASLMHPLCIKNFLINKTFLL